MTPAPEFSRPERLDTIGAGDRMIAVQAEEQERAALAKRFGLLAIDTLMADFSVKRDAGGIVARGSIRAKVTQACVVTGDAIAVTVNEPVALRFVAGLSPEGDEVELTGDDCDTMSFDGQAIDLGEAAAETMALALDPFPRGPNAAAVLAESGVIGEEEAKPLGALAGLRAALRGDQS